MTTPPIIATRLRQIRKAQGLTLKQVEIRSRGEWKGVVVGSYERGIRSLSVDKALRLCDFYGVPHHALFADIQADSAVARIGSIDLQAFRNFPSDQDSFAQALGRMIGVIIRSRGDWNGHVITLRRSDWEGLATFLGSTLQQVGIAIENRGLEFKIARNATKQPKGTK